MKKKIIIFVSIIILVFSAFIFIFINLNNKEKKEFSPNYEEQENLNNVLDQKQEEIHQTTQVDSSSEIEETDSSIKNEVINNIEKNKDEKPTSSNNQTQTPIVTPKPTPTPTPIETPKENENVQPVPTTTPTPQPTETKKTDLQEAIDYHLSTGDKLTYKNGIPLTLEQCRELGDIVYSRQDTSYVYRYSCKYTDNETVTVAGLKVKFIYNDIEYYEYYDDYYRITNQTEDYLSLIH